MKKLLLCAAAIAGIAQPSIAAQPKAVTQPALAETSIPFASMGGIRDWERESDKSILLRDRTGRWYRATFLGTCPRLGYSQTLLFRTDVSGSFDRFSAIKSDYGYCQVGSVVRAAAPLSKGGR